MRYTLFAVLAISILSVWLGGCGERPRAPPLQATVSGPVFPASRFDPVAEPLPPDAAKVANRAASAAAYYEGRLRNWGRACHLQLTSVGDELRAAGQVEGAR